jgi:hypothetical protein
MERVDLSESVLRSVKGNALLDESQVKVLELPVCHNDNSRPMTEALDVVQMSTNRFRLIYSPGAVEGLAKDDEFELSATDPKRFHVLRRSGYLCVWFYFKEAGLNQGPCGNRVRSVIEEFGGICDGGGNTHLVFSIPVALGFPELEAMLNDLTMQYYGSTWLYGNVYDPWNELKPLDWWNELSKPLKL